MQPYFLPYAGYFQLINAVDVFVLYDDVDYIKGGWINRNNLKFKNKELRFTVPLEKSSSFKKISETYLSKNYSFWLDKFEKSINQTFAKRIVNSEILKVIFEAMRNDEFNSISELNKELIVKICSHLNIQTKIISSSSLNDSKELTGVERVVSICKQLKGNVYINSIGGQNLYNRDYFKKNNLDLYFLKSELTENSLYKGSILTPLLTESNTTITNDLTKFSLV